MADEIKAPEPGQAVTSTTETVPHPADASSGPGPYDNLSPDRPPVSTTRPDVPIAHSLVAGAGAGDQNVVEAETEEAPATRSSGAKKAE